MLTRLLAIRSLVVGQTSRFFAAGVALIIAASLLYLAPLIVQVTLDSAIAGAEPAGRVSALVLRAMGGAAAVSDQLWRPALAVVAVTMLAGVFTYLRGRWAAQATEGSILRLRERVYDHLQRLPGRYFDSVQTGDLVQRSTSDVETVRTFLGTQVVEIIRALVMLLVPIPLMLTIDGRMTGVAVLLLPVIVGFSLVYFGQVRRMFKEVDEAEGRMTSTVQENLTGIRVVRAYARQDHEREKFAERNRTHRDLDERLFQLAARFWSISDFFCFAQVGLVIATGLVLLRRGELSVGSFFFFLSSVGMFVWPVRMMGRILTDLGKALVAIDRLEEVLGEPEEGADEVGAPADDWVGGIAFENVSFAHGEAAVLHEMSFSVEKGQTLALFGPSGSGKSTIINLLLRLYDLEVGGSGTIRLDHLDLAGLDRRSVRRRCAVVLQEPFLYSRTLRENIMLARANAAEKEMIEATTVACVHETIAAFDQGYETHVGERGVTLSGGQRQRVALARALLAEPVLLILDDALSAVDAETESFILGALQQRRGRQTSIVVAHRLATLRHADQILVIDEGRIVERGDHTALLQANGFYARVWNLQTNVSDDLDQDTMSVEAGGQSHE